jgi:AcrR family transcriptional regulator
VPALARPPRPSPPSRSSRPRSTRRRGQELEDALLDAAWAELAEAGYRQLTMEAIAERAGTSRAVLYRRWHGLPELVIAAIRRHRPMLSGSVPDTGSLRGDVLALLRRASAGLTAMGHETVYGLLGDYFADSSRFGETEGEVFQISSDAMAAILARALARGEIRGQISDRVAALPITLFRNELFSTRAAATDAALVEIVDDLFLPLVIKGRPE